VEPGVRVTNSGTTYAWDAFTVFNIQRENKANIIRDGYSKGLLPFAFAVHHVDMTRKETPADGKSKCRRIAPEVQQGTRREGGRQSHGRQG